METDRVFIKIKSIAITIDPSTTRDQHLSEKTKAYLVCSLVKRGVEITDEKFFTSEKMPYVFDRLSSMVSGDCGAAADLINEGCRVEANRRCRGKWYPGKVTRYDEDGTFDITYDNGESEKFVKKELIRLLGSEYKFELANVELGNNS